jgi:hypothetical protein
MCWAQNPKKRPTFASLAKSLEQNVLGSFGESSSSESEYEPIRKNTSPKYANGYGDNRPYGDKDQDDHYQKSQIDKKESAYQLSSLPEKKDSTYQLSVVPEKKDEIYEKSNIPEKKSESAYELSYVPEKKDSLYSLTEKKEKKPQGKKSAKNENFDIPTTQDDIYEVSPSALK